LAWIDIPIALVVAIVAGAGWLYFRNERVGVAGEFLYRVGMFGRRRRWSLRDLASVVRVQVIAGTYLSNKAADYSLPTRTVLSADVVVSNAGRAVQSFTGWPERELDGLWSEANLPVVHPWTAPVGVRELRQWYPGAVPALMEPQDTPGAEARTMLRVGLVFGGCAVLAAVIFAVAVVVAALRS
jgi:hypothetical protein